MKMAVLPGHCTEIHTARRKYGDIVIENCSKKMALAYSQILEVSPMQPHLQPHMQPQMQDEVRVQLRGVIAAVRRHEDPDEMEKEVKGVLRTVLEAQVKLEETAQARFATAMQAHIHHQKQAEDARKRMEKAESEKKEDERKKAEEELEKAKEEAEKAKAAVRKAVENRMDFERTEGLEEENEYILRRVLAGKRTAYEETTEEEMEEMQERALAHHLAKRGVDYSAVKRRVRDGTATDADRAVEEWVRDNRRKAHWPRNALHAVMEMDAERDEKDEKGEKDERGEGSE